MGQRCDGLLLQPGEVVIERVSRCLGIVRIEAVLVRAVVDVELGSERQAEALDRAEPGAELLLGEPLGERGALELGKGGETPLDQAFADELVVAGVRHRIVPVRRREETIEARLVAHEGFAQLTGERGEHLALVPREPDAVPSAARAADSPTETHGDTRYGTRQSRG